MSVARRPKRTVELEVCADIAWILTHYLCARFLRPDGQRDAAEVARYRLCEELQRLGYSVRYAPRRRVLQCRWNENGWVWCCGPVGTFDRLSEDDMRKIVDVIFYIRDEVEQMFSNRE